MPLAPLSSGGAFDNNEAKFPSERPFRSVTTRAVILTLFGSRAYFGVKKQSRALASMIFKKTPVREQLATGGGGVQIEFFPGENPRPATHRAKKHTLGRGGHFICHRGVSYYGKNTKFAIKRFPSKPGGHFLEARRAFFSPRAPWSNYISLRSQCH